MTRPLAGIVVASMCRDEENQSEHGRPVLLALCQLAYLLKWTPFSVLVSPTGATRYYRAKDGMWARSPAVPSALLAHSTQREFGQTTDGRLLVVHVGTKSDYIHAGLLPWVALYGGGSGVLSSSPRSIHNILPSLLSDNTTVMIAACDGPVQPVLAPAARAWHGLMVQLRHRS